MLYADYARRKMHNVVKLDTKEGYPLTVYNCANKNLKDYTIYGNTGGVGDKTENLFKYNNPYYLEHIDLCKDGWWDITIDNTEGTSYKAVYPFVNANKILKPSTDYYVYLEIAEKSNIGFTLSAAQSDSTFEQFITRLVGTSGIATTRDDFSKCKIMLRTSMSCPPGKLGHIKYRIAVYETEKNYFEPYDKYKIPIMVTGKNLFDKSSIITGTRLILNGDLVSTDDDSIPAETKTMFVSEFIEIEPNKNLTFSINMYGYKHRLCYYDQDKKFITINETDTNTVTTPDNAKYIRFNGYLSELDTFMLEEGTTATAYEPYREPVTTNIYRDAQLVQGESINYKSDNLPDITLEKGTNTITANTEVKPSSIKIKYLKK